MPHNAKEVVHQSAALRGKYQFREAVDLVKGSYQDLDDSDLQFNVVREAFEAAKEAGWTDEAKQWAAKMYALEPGFPGIKGYV